MNGLWKSVLENVVFVLEFLAVAAAIFIAAYAIEKAARKKRGSREKILSTRKLAMIGMFSAIAVVFHIFDFPLPFAPDFYKVDLSELPVMVGTFALGPVAGVMMEFCKILLKLVFKGTSTAFVGDLANFVVGCSLILPASLVYEFGKTKKGAVLGMAAGTVCMTVFGTLFNAVYLLPTFAKLYGVPLDTLIGMGNAINPAINSVTTFVCFAVAPLNILKAGVVSVVTLLIYKPLSPVIKSGRQAAADSRTARAR